MRFYLDSAVPEEISEAAHCSFVAGITTNPDILDRAGVRSLQPWLAHVVERGRRDWKLWLQLAQSDYESHLEQARVLTELVGQLSGGPLAGPTLVFKIMPSPEGLFAASTLIKEGREVCITGIANPVQALAAATLPEVVEHGDGGFLTEGPPASRNPQMPHSLACYVGRLDDRGEDGVATLAALNDLLVATGSRSRILAASVRTRHRLDALVARLSRSGTCRVDVTLPFGLLNAVLQDPATTTAAQSFAALERGNSP